MTLFVQRYVWLILLSKFLHYKIHIHFNHTGYRQYRYRQRRCSMIRQPYVIYQVACRFNISVRIIFYGISVPSVRVRPLRKSLLFARLLYQFLICSKWLVSTGLRITTCHASCTCHTWRCWSNYAWRCIGNKWQATIASSHASAHTSNRLMHWSWPCRLSLPARCPKPLPRTDPD